MHHGRRLPRWLCALVLVVWTSARAEVAQLVRDIRPGDDFPDDAGSYPEQLTAFGDKVAFVGQVWPIGAEIWIVDAATRRVTSLGDLCPGDCSEHPRILGVAAGKLFFRTPSFLNARLWASDGTPAGTFDLAPESTGITAVSGTELGPQGLRFLARHADSSLRLWRSDGTPAGTTEVALLVADGSAVTGFAAASAGSRTVIFLRSSTTLRLLASDGTSGGTREIATVPVTGFDPLRVWASTSSRVFFTANGAGGDELWASDGTAAGTRQVSAFAAPQPFEPTRWMKPLGRYVYFLADDGSHDVEIWRSDGTAGGTTRVTDFAYEDAFTQWGQDPDPIEEVAGKLVFFVDDGSGVLALWTSGGTPASSRSLLVPCPEGCTDFLEEPWLRRLGDRVYFEGSSAAGQELWSTDGTVAGTHQVADVCPGPCSADIPPPRVVGDRIYFVANALSFVAQLWSSDGTAAGTHAITRFATRDGFEYLFRATPEIVDAGGRLWFQAAEGPYGPELWSSQGTADTSELVADLVGGAVSSGPRGLVGLGERAIFTACDSRSREVWASAGNAESTLPVSALDADCDFSEEIEPVVSGSRAFFWERDIFGAFNRLWSTDGKEAGLVFNLPAGEPFESLLPIAGGVAFVVRGDLDDFTLWSSDGTAGGTGVRVELPPYPSIVWAEGTSVYYVVREENLNHQLWRADVAAATKQQLTSFDHPGAVSDTLFARLGAQLYFRVRRPGFSTELWRTDGTPAGTQLAVTLPAAAGDEIVNLEAAGGALYFQGRRYDSSGFQLWRSDGTSAGTVQLGSFPSLSIGDYPPVDATFAHGRVFFVATDDDHGRELWTTDGTPQGTRLVRDILPGPAGSFPSELTVAAGRLFFVADDRAHGRELWESDGTAAGTRLVHDIVPGALGSVPVDLTATAAALFFTADDGLSGREPWVLPLGATASCAAGDGALCLGGGRFRVEAAWRDFEGNVGRGHAAALTGDTGTFWFFSPSNVEVIVKVLDGRPLNDHQWVFYGALSSVEYTLTVTDTQTGAVRRYFNAPGRLASVGDTEAFGPRGAAAARRQARLAREAAPPPLVAERRDAAAKAVCEASATRLCLAGGRFAVDVAWRDFAGATGIGTGTTLTTDTGHFWFFSPSNVELVVKVLDGRPVNGKFWLFYGALSSVEYTLTVTDTQTGAVRTYTNPSGRLASVADTSAF